MELKNRWLNSARDQKDSVPWDVLNVTMWLTGYLCLNLEAVEVVAGHVRIYHFIF